MRAAELLLRGRRAAEEKMVDSCTIRRPGTLITDRSTGKVTKTSTVIYSGKCEVQSKNTSTANPESGEHSFTIVSRQVKIPANAADIHDGDVVTLDTSLLNAFVAGKEYVVDGFTPDSYDTAARLPVKEITS
jgi:hypothetical protein